MFFVYYRPKEESEKKVGFSLNDALSHEAEDTSLVSC